MLGMQIHQQARPQVVMPGRQFVVSNPAARQSSTVVRVQSPQYAPAAQPMEIVEAEGNYPVAASRKSYAPAVRLHARVVPLWIVSDTLHLVRAWKICPN